MFKYIFFILLFANIYSFSLEEKKDFLESFDFDIKKALNFIDDNILLIEEVFNQYNIDLSLALSIMFPELIRYNSLKDQIEISINKMFYISGGVESSDLSIGILQMKPSFIDRLSNSKKLNFYDTLFVYPNNFSNKDIRKVIIDRLQDIEYQLKYLAYFIAIIDASNENKFENQYDKIKYYATAYNAGAWYNKTNNEKLSKKKTYPYGPNNTKIKQYSYSDISLYYYQNILNK